MYGSLKEKGMRRVSQRSSRTCVVVVAEVPENSELVPARRQHVRDSWIGSQERRQLRGRSCHEVTAPAPTPTPRRAPSTSALDRGWPLEFAVRLHPAAWRLASLLQRHDHARRLVLAFAHCLCRETTSVPNLVNGHFLLRRRRRCERVLHQLVEIFSEARLWIVLDWACRMGISLTQRGRVRPIFVRP